MENDIKECRIVEKIFIRKRWHVRIEPSFNRKKTIPLAQYNWLIGNPAFEAIPKGYVIHHLDHDELNDDISNLALMQKHHHAAHHWKQKKIGSDIKINIEYNRVERTAYFPLSEPNIGYNKKHNHYYLRFYEDISGEKKRKYLARMEGKTFRTKKDAEEAKKKIWPQKS